MPTNPIIRRELMTVLRTRRAAAILLAVIAALTVLVLLRWPGDAQVNLSGQQAQQVLRVFGYGMLVVCVLLAPAFPATSIVKEKRSGTLQLLLRSPMSPMEILLGKLVGVTGFVLLLVAMSLPAAAATLVMGGVDPVGQLLAVYVVIVLLALQYATLGLAVSSVAQSSDSALRLTYGLVLALAIALGLAAGGQRERVRRLAAPAGRSIAWLAGGAGSILAALGAVQLLSRGLG